LDVGAGLQIAVNNSFSDFYPLQTYHFDSTDNTQGPTTIFTRSKSDTIGTISAVNADDGLGTLLFRGAGTSAYVNGALIKAEVDSGTVSNTSMPGRLVFSTTADGDSSPTERMRIEKDGDIRLGSSSNYSFIRPWDTTTGNLIIGADQSATGVGGSATIFRSRGSEKARIDSSGRLGLGTSIPQAKMEIVENAGGLDLVTPLRLSGTAVNNDDGWKLQFYNNTAAQEQGSLLVQYKTVGFWKTSLTSTDNVTFDTAGNERVRIDSSGRVGIGTTAATELLSVNGNIWLGNGGGSGGSEMLRIWNDSGVERIHASNNPSALAFGIGGSAGTNEAFRVDANKRLLVGTSTSGDVGSALQVASTAFGVAEIFRTGSFGASLFIGSAGPGTLASPSALTNGEAAGYLTFRGYDSAAWRTGANISAHADGQTWASGDCPGRLVFSTTESGDSSPTERMRISSTGALGLSGANYGASGQVLTSNGSGSAPTWQNSATAQAWVHFDGTAATVTPADSYNVSSITDNGTGNYTVNLTNTLGSSSPACFASGTATSSRIGNASPNATDPDDKIDVGFKGTNDQLYNDANVSVVVFA
jgi:hypothetical protein